MIYLPDGVQDFLPEEYRVKRKIEEKFREVFIKFGYQEIMPPTFEYSDNFSVLFDENNLYRFFDKKGNILALRPDVTTQIARIVSTKLKGSFPLKLCYVANVYRYDDPQVGKMREFTQAGIELIGTNHEESDAEIITVAIEALKSIGIEDFKVDVGQVEFFKRVVEDLELQNEEINLLREFLQQKNQSAIEEFINDKGIRGKKAKFLSELPLLFGGEEVLKRVKELYDTPKLGETIDYLERVYRILKDFGMEEYISFDLGMVQNLNYYTGIIFRCFVKGIGYAICTGGRYDGLLGIFGEHIPATGFAISVERSMLALQKQKKDIIDKSWRVLIKYKENLRSNAYKKATLLRGEGKIVEMYSYEKAKHVDENSFDEIIDMEE
ncbi:ATP phosphoribosyltransferase regulatory subunit [Thermoanaerobacter siderophilus]|uniref:ATP phosphoribosyltransferase regulatory subunit n=1 Tax=Thermoanaerobacter siderophilus SR4 TaxID=880478 RepID=I9KS58_9THEO|nr:ATP phosphoribosyltransferase regulatory subunit [Thermoanaerobacter siderophilus]EIV99655.1 ATP phosphoribosyltransferase, regulatory subunit [Thermoanaerobacter siderophilus SR4]